ncbi:TIGR03663 family protein [Thermomicrobiaceae bacterium CFH 74404]|uniref:TIGR03663 family protein n=1 Tax=Thermalbibacter longus TaxID=2951981 RepID=A0AA42BCC3_9BACT|nr:flippase activity-associated protein Agl23 [Thermalbibacter longus]MCM8748623.1 TIGR03663 family protein [Thermalbibacter longus]
MSTRRWARRAVPGEGAAPNGRVAASPTAVAPTAIPPSRRGLRAPALRPPVELLLYVAIALAALLSRFWDLGSRALHHDESLHAYYSWIYAEGEGYIHHPLMHGPALFHLDALAYLLFGATDYVTRVPAAVFGVALVLLPALLRGEGLLGRWGALLASFLLLVSPSTLYFSRFIRHDIFALAGTFLLFIALLRYVERPERRWLITGGVTIGFMLTTHEVTFVSLFILVTFILIAIAYRVAPALFWIFGAGLIALGLLAAGLDRLGVAPLPEIPWQNPTRDAVLAYLVALVRHPLVVGALGIALLTVIGSLWLLDRIRDPDRGWIDGLFGAAPPGTTARALADALADRTGLALGAGLGLALFTLLYTSLFTNPGGLASGTVGALGYWLGQHGVQRGEQPWFYYLLLLPQYEYLAALLFPVGIGIVAGQGLRALVRGQELDGRWYTRALLVYWGAVMLAVLSWAGEKMPWLVVHITLPLTLLAASLLGSGAERLERAWTSWNARQRSRSVYLGLASLGLAAAWFLLMAWGSAGPFVQSTTSGFPQLVRAIRPEIAGHWRWLWLPLVVVAVIAATVAAERRSRPHLLTMSAALSLGLVLLQIHAGWRLTYREGDVPRDMLIYVQTSPQVVQLTRDLEALSHELTGGMGLEVWYDSGTQWPMNWYLREFTSRRYFGTTLRELPADPPPVILYSLEYLNNMSPEAARQLESQYTYVEYPMRWWFPEDQTYRRFAIAPELKNEARQNYQTDQPPPYSAGDVLRSVWSSISSLQRPEQQAKVFRLVAFRELPATIGSYRFRVYIRNDLVPYVNDLRYGDSGSAAAHEDVASAATQHDEEHAGDPGNAGTRAS